MKVFQKRSVAAVVMALAIAAGILLGQARKPEGLGQASTAVVGTYTYVYDYAGVLTDKTMTYIDEMNTSLFAQTGAQIMVQTVDSTGGTDIVDYAVQLGAAYGVGSAERDNGLVLVLALEDLADNGLVGNYGIAGGDGLYKYGNELTSMLYVYMEEDFAAGDYDAAVRKTVKAYMDWFADLYGVTVRENYIPAVRENFSAGSGYYTETTGAVAPRVSSVKAKPMVWARWLMVNSPLRNSSNFSKNSATVQCGSARAKPEVSQAFGSVLQIRRYLYSSFASHFEKSGV